MRFYVAAFIGEKERVRQIQHELRTLGHEISEDWTLYDGIPIGERDRLPDKVGEIAIRDMRGVRNCEVFLLLSDPPDGRAKYVELGAAILSAIEHGRPRIYVLGEATNHSVFFYHPVVRRALTLQDVLEDLHPTASDEEGRNPAVTT